MSELNIFGEVTNKNEFVGIDEGSQFVVIGDEDGVVYTKESDGTVSADGMETLSNSEARVAFKDATLRQL